MNALLYGMRVIVTPDRRRYDKLPDDVQVSATFRAEFNAWAERFFQPCPTLNTIKDGEVIAAGNMLFMNQRMADQLKKATS